MDSPPANAKSVIEDKDKSLLEELTVDLLSKDYVDMINTWVYRMEKNAKDPKPVYRLIQIKDIKFRNDSTQYNMDNYFKSYSYHYYQDTKVKEEPEEYGKMLTFYLLTDEAIAKFSAPVDVPPSSSSIPASNSSVDNNAKIVDYLTYLFSDKTAVYSKLPDNIKGGRRRKSSRGKTSRRRSTRAPRKMHRYNYI